MTLRKKCQIIKSDRVLFSIIIIHLLLVFFHCAYSFFTDYWQCYVRAGFCFLIAASTFLFLRKGFAVTIAIYAYVLLYFNRFFNYTSFLFVLFAIYSYQKIEKPALVLYALNLFISFAIKNYSILTLGINGLNCILFYTLAKYLFATKVQSVLLLTDDERIVLEELASGKLQKEIKQFTENQVTQIIKNAVSRNLCKSKAELLQKYIKEYPERIVTESQDDVI
jgi:DNA-binding CsgD family transcriptional regulator